MEVVNQLRHSIWKLSKMRSVYLTELVVRVDQIKQMWTHGQRTLQVGGSEFPKKA